MVSDYLTSEKPYAVANTSGMTEDEFRGTFPTVRAGTVLSPDAHQLPALLESVRDPEKDTMARARRELKTHLLGPSDPPSRVRFNAAALELAAARPRRATWRVARRTAEIPGQRELQEAAEEAELEAPGTADPEDAVST